MWRSSCSPLSGISKTAYRPSRTGLLIISPRATTIIASCRWQVKPWTKARLQFRVRALEDRIGGKHDFENIIGESAEIKEAIALARKVAGTDVTVLLLGETGSGKEVFAQAIHRASERGSQPFVAVNCSAFGREILESELFGHKAGAFTSAIKDKKGFLEEAHNGTIFLDEIGEMAIELQAKLLRVLETREFYKVGDSKPIKVNIRIIAATNRELEKEIAEGHFRADLYYRLSAFQIKLPSLNERRKDIPLLAQYFIQQLAPKNGRKISGMTEAFSKALREHSWKGNIRELRNVIERAVILSDTPELDVSALPLDFRMNGPADDALTLADAERRHIIRILQLVKGNKTKAAEVMQIGLTTFTTRSKSTTFNNPFLQTPFRSCMVPAVGPAGHVEINNCSSVS